MFFLALLTGCLDPYEPPVTKEAADFLVVDAQLNTTNQVAFVKLSRGVALTSEKEPAPVSDAIVSILDSEGQLRTLDATGDGRYELHSYYNPELQYKLTLRLKTGVIYASEWITPQKNFDIEDLRWSADDDGLKFFVTTKAAGNGPFYFRYAYEETYEYRSVFASDWKFIGPLPIYRTLDENISTCWMTNKSSIALLTTTEGLQQNLIADYNVLRIPRGDRRLWFGYSLLVKQYAIDQQAYDYWEKLRKVSESLGGLFDPIPFSVTGNIYLDRNGDGEPDKESPGIERALGYFSAGSVTTRRINIRNFELPSGYYGIQQNDCAEAYVEIGKLSSIEGRQINLTRAQYEGLAIIGYYYAIPACTDCRLEGGSPLKPFYMN